MRSMVTSFVSGRCGLILALAWFGIEVGAGAPARGIPRPLPAHPGNIFLAEEPVRLTAALGEGEAWRAIDYEGNVVALGHATNTVAELGRLPVGFYEVLWAKGEETNRVSLGVLAPLSAPTPLSSPVSIDVAMSWFYPPDKMDAIANLCALAGVNHVRDRLAWKELEPQRDKFSGTNRYDQAAQAQSAAGLQVLQVNHSTPAWANPVTKRFPLDLRDAYNFHRHLARRWRGQVDAFEPWNEADVDTFGGHTGSEMASLQKAAWLGIKAGNPKATVCWNVFAIHRASTLRDFDQNQAWPYFDTFNLHHYEGLDRYPQLYADFRAVSAGKPLWVTECSVPVKWHGDERLKEPTPEDRRLQSERVAKIYASALHEGAAAVFYFMLPHYVEGQIQFGILRPDLTPRPAYLAVAAAGRFLADARPLGRIETASRSLHGFLFAARPDGKPANVLVIWSDRETSFDLPNRPSACFDHLGRPRHVRDGRLSLGSAPVFVLLPRSAVLPVVLPPQAPVRRPGTPSTIVFQAVVPESEVLLDRSAYCVAPGNPARFNVYAYNFGEEKARGWVSVTAPDGWAASYTWDLEVPPGQRTPLDLELNPTPGSVISNATIQIIGEFGRAGKAVLSFRVAERK